MNNFIKIVHLYPREMNTYGDTGNILVLRRRLEWRQIRADIKWVGIGEKLPTDTDIIVAGGGQDSGQLSVEKDLQRKKNTLFAMAEQGVVMLVVCGMYQLFGHFFLSKNNQTIKGIDILDIETRAPPQAKRFTGQIVTDSIFGTLIGYENHSGMTHLGSQSTPLGHVAFGTGNNLSDKTEGAIQNNVFGTYLHGPVLSKNPNFADALIKRALSRQSGNIHLSDLDDRLEHQCRSWILKGFCDETWP